MKILAIFLVSFGTALSSLYISDPPVKLLSAKLFGQLYPTADSVYRIFSSGEDHEVSLSGLEEANQMPNEQLVLPPGGRAVFNLPMNKDLLYLMVKPGKKEEGSGSPFSDKANITMTAAWSEEEDGLSVDCHQTSHDTSASADHYCTLNLETIKDSAQDNLLVTLTVPSGEVRNAFLWQLHLSPLDDSERVMATFMDDGRQLMRKTQEDEASNTWLTMVSIVGNTGVGKSTVASLLSGNETMFKAKASSSGTTTIGADISPIIPGYEYRERMEEVLGQGALFQPAQSRPLFLLDSEGMSFRGDEVDFVTTGPVAIIANIIIWITTGRMRAPEILEEVDDYLKGLDRITMGDDSSEEQGYGEFIIVLNMMQIADQGSSDEEICEELMAWGSSTDDDAIREEMTMRFKEIVCVGLPTMELHENETIGYEVLKRYPRFQEGLMKLGNRILVESETSIDVQVGTNSYEMNSTEAETIIGMLIDGANQGNIDLSDFCNVIFSISKQKVIQEMGRSTTEIHEATEGHCNNETQSCTACVCDFKNKVVGITTTNLEGIITNAIEEAELLCENRPDIIESIVGIKEDMIVPWASLNRCNGVDSNLDPASQHCDLSEITSAINKPGEEVHLLCDALFICGEIVINANTVNITSNSIYVAQSTKIDTDDLGKAEKGGKGSLPEEDGSNGANGRDAGSMTINSQVMLTGSDNTVMFTSMGQSGGDGGDGADGWEGDTGSIAGKPSAEKVISDGTLYAEEHSKQRECHVIHCHCDRDYWHYRMNITYNACGGNGGNGGNGGFGGAAGCLTILGSSGVSANNNPRGSSGGDYGRGGAVGLGIYSEKTYTAVHYHWEKADCGFLTGGCDYTDHYANQGPELEIDNSDYLCSGNTGKDGGAGLGWIP